jgi:hypothetical protein
MVIAILQNTSLNRWHPIVFRESPFPGGRQLEAGKRYKSAGHHTDGFSTRDEAEAEAKAMCKRNGADFATDVVFEWNGSGTPAMVVFFNGTQPMLVG